MAEEEISPVHYEDLANLEAEFDEIDNQMRLYHRSALTQLFGPNKEQCASNTS